MIVPSVQLRDRTLNSTGRAKLNKEKNKKFLAEKSILTPVESTKRSQNRREISSNFADSCAPAHPSLRPDLPMRQARPMVCDLSQRPFADHLLTHST
jgi:hypothetical protein